MSGVAPLSRLGRLLRSPLVDSLGWSRPSGANAGTDFLGMTCVIRGEGTKHGHSIWQCTNTETTITVGTTALKFRKIGGDRRED